MKKNVSVFQNPDFGQIRVTEIDGEPWFVGKDVATILGYAKPLNALAMHVDEDDSLKWGLTDNLGRKQSTILINESGLYALVLSSKLQQAKAFKHWVTKEVLPQIRKTGGYIPTSAEDDENTILAKALLIAQKTIEQKDSLIEAQKPMVEFAQAVTSSNGSILIRDLAKLITQNGVALGEKKLYKWLRQNGYIFKENTRPIQKWVEQGLFDTKVTLINTYYGVMERVTTMVTGKGQQYFIDGFVNGKFVYSDNVQQNDWDPFFL